MVNSLVRSDDLLLVSIPFSGVDRFDDSDRTVCGRSGSVLCPTGVCVLVRVGSSRFKPDRLGST